MITVKLPKLHLLAVAAMACTLTSSSREAAADESGSRELAAAGVSRIEVRTCSGDVTVHSASTDRIELRWNREPAPKAELSGEHLEIQTTRDDGKCPRGLEREPNLVILAPAGIALRVNTVSGDINVEQRKAEVSTKTVSGDVHLAGIEARVTAKAVSGDVGITASHPEIDAKSVSGNIEATEISGTIELEAVSGDLTVKASKLDELEAKTVSGEIEVRDVTAEDVRVNSLSGDIRWRGEPPKRWNALRTFSGTISVEPKETK